MRPFAQTVLWLALVGVCQANSPPTQTIPVSDSNWFFSPYNWFKNGSASAVTQNYGAYFTVGFTGTQVALGVDVSFLDGSVAAQWPLIRWQIDGNPTQDIRLKQQDVQISLNSEPLAQGPHSLTVWLVAGNTHEDRWLVPVQALRITGLMIDADGSTLPPTLRPARMVFYGDSITEGLWTESQNPGNKLISSDATHAYIYTCASTLNAEFGVVGFAGLGWTVSANADSNVPPFFPETWKEQFAGQDRSFSPAPDYVVVMLGGNDFFLGADPGNVASTVTSWLVEARSLLPTSKISVVIEFDGYERDAVTAGFLTYQLSSPDANAILIDLGPSAQTGIDSGGYVPGGTPTSYDGVHPNAARAAELGAQLAAAIKSAMGEQ